MVAREDVDQFVLIEGELRGDRGTTVGARPTAEVLEVHDTRWIVMDLDGGIDSSGHQAASSVGADHESRPVGGAVASNHARDVSGIKEQIGHRGVGEERDRRQLGGACRKDRVEGAASNREAETVLTRFLWWSNLTLGRATGVVDLGTQGGSLCRCQAAAGCEGV